MYDYQSVSKKTSKQKNIRKMANPYFQFKQFVVWHDKCGMKVGTDGVLLGAWAPVANARRILDVGTGTGLVALMTAQRSPADARIVALEIDEAAALQAQENVLRSPWKERIEVVRADFRHYRTEGKFDAIVSNPPYFVDSLACPDRQRSTARHTQTLTYSELTAGAAALLSDRGVFTVVLPTDVEAHVKELALRNGLHAIRQLDVITKPGGEPKRTLIAFSFHQQECHTERLLTEHSRHQYSPEYIALTREYYLNM